jgi:hypothetical protein
MLFPGGPCNRKKRGKEVFPCHADSSVHSTSRSVQRILAVAVACPPWLDTAVTALPGAGMARELRTATRHAFVASTVAVPITFAPERTVMVFPGTLPVPLIDHVAPRVVKDALEMVSTSSGITVVRWLSTPPAEEVTVTEAGGMPLGMFTTSEPTPPATVRGPKPTAVRVTGGAPASLELASMVN